MVAPVEGYPLWATQALTEVINGKSYLNKVEPPIEVKNSGLKYEEPMARAWNNYQMDLVSRWIEYLDLEITGGSTQIGWLAYRDDQYDSGSPFSLTAGASTAIPNNGATTITDGAPTNGDTFWNTSEITADNQGDGFIIDVKFTVESSQDGFPLEFHLEDGLGATLSADQRYYHGNGNSTPTTLNFTTNFYITADFAANGGIPKLYVPLGVNASIYDIEFIIRRHSYKDNS